MPVSTTARALRTDVATLDCDITVNATNDSLFGRGGVGGAIYRATEPELLEACRAFHGCRTSKAELTPGFRLPIRYIVHTVGPIWCGDRQDEVALLATCYRSGLELVRGHEVRSIMLPCINTGVYGSPPQLATPIAVRAVCEHGAGLDAITFCCFSATHLALYEAALASDK